MYLAGLFDDGWRAAKHRERKTLLPLSQGHTLCAPRAQGGHGLIAPHLHTLPLGVGVGRLVPVYSNSRK